MARADETYNQLLKKILDNGSKKKDRTGTGTISLFGEQIKFNMSDGVPLLTTKKIHTKSVIHELLWFLNGDTNVKYLKDNGVSIWDEWADDDGELGPVYGKQWVDWGGYYSTGHWNRNTNSLGMHLKGINQIQEIMNTLQTDPDSRRMVVSAWNVGEIPQMKLPPCHAFFQFYTEELKMSERLEYYLESNPLANHVRDLTSKKLDALRVPTRKLSLMWYQRSVDTFLGLPFNIASYAFLLHMVAQQTNLIPHELIGNFGDTHIYDNHIEYVQQQLRRGTKLAPPHLKLNNTTNIFYDVST